MIILIVYVYCLLHFARAGNCFMPYGFHCADPCDYSAGICMGPCEPEFTGPDCRARVMQQGNGYRPNIPGGPPCAPICNGCTGPTPMECKLCTEHAHMRGGQCFCDDYYKGEDCKSYIGSCHPNCYKAGGCTGPGPNDCLSCPQHSVRDMYGKCVCDPYWSGKDCNIYSGPCDPRCKGCHGPGADDCEQCVSNASLDRMGRCSCNYHWSGPDCSQFTGKCNPKCADCYGPSSSDCTFCTNHAEKDQYGTCNCGAFWSGEDCAIYSGVCDDKCTKCSGPDPSECSACVENAHFNKYLSCVCNEPWTGQGCQQFGGLCHPLCGQCTGVSLADCVTCVENASMNKLGLCGCDFGWAGESCTEYSGECDILCDPSQGCQGPKAFNCVGCRNNAYRNSYGACVCINNWGGKYCQDYVGTCDPRCNGCIGSEGNHCIECVAHSSQDSKGYCVCDTYFAGSNCALYVGPCHPRCSGLGCSGPESYECESCVEHAHGNDCTCDQHWIGFNCSTYIGNCDLKCDGQFGCTGPTASNCRLCNDHSTPNKLSNVCECHENWGGPDCYTYLGECASTCSNSCIGPSAHACNSCVRNAYRDPRGACVCADGYGSADCSLYVGPCDHRCLSCFGPTNNECSSCVLHAVKTGTLCDCQDGHTTTGCRGYDGICHTMCDRDQCYGPGAHECLSCIPNAYRDAKDEGRWKCAPQFAGDTCENFDQRYCDPRCTKCTGPSNQQCSACVKNSHLNEFDECECDEHWTGHDCSAYFGACASGCRTCIGPFDTQCLSCFGNAKHQGGKCSCEENWTGEKCDLYNGPCSSACESCTGPGTENCTQCTQNAYLNDGMHCECMPDWQGESCTTYVGVCNSKCDQCSGPSAADCRTCTVNSHWEHGVCTCDADFSGDDCLSYSGQCYSLCKRGCYGPRATDCMECLTDDEAEHACNCLSADLAITMGCRCDGVSCQVDCVSGWGGSTCSQYIGECHSTCNGCYGPSARQCLRCVPNAGLISGQCICNVDWNTEAECSVYSGKCSPKCKDQTTQLSCPSGKAHCVECVENAYRDASGVCQCESGWGSDDCSAYKGQCHPRCLNAQSCNGPSFNDCIELKPNVASEIFCTKGWTGELCDLFTGGCDPKCISCTGPTAHDCTYCIMTAYRDETGECACDPGFSGPNCTFSGECYPTCDGCHGTTARDCKTCVQHASRNEFSECVCGKDWWFSPDCSKYNGGCDSRCNGSCTGPSNAECVGCSENVGVVASFTGTQCTCADDYIGDGCLLYVGACNPKCAGCFGPTAADCVACSHHAGFQNGSCACVQGWVGEGCTMPTPSCYPTCRTCYGTEPNECESCYHGFYLDHNNSCEDCSCNGMPCTYNSGVIRCQCDPGYYWDLGLAQCVLCSPRCAECDDWQHCTKCATGFIEPKEGFCDCEVGMWSDSFFRCVTECPIVGESNCDAQRSEIPSQGRIDFSQPIRLPVDLSRQNVYTISSEKPPHIPEYSESATRGAYFNGEDQFLLITTHLPAYFGLGLWTRPYTSGTLISIFGEKWDRDRYRTGQCTWPDCLNESSSAEMHFYMTNCNSLAVDYLGETLVVSQMYTYQLSYWGQVSVQILKDYTFSGEVEIRILSNQNTVAFARSNAEIAYAISEIYIGSYRKTMNFIKASVYDFFIVPNPFAKLYNINTIGCPNGSEVCPVNSDYNEQIQLNMCDIDQYNSGNQCLACHSTCKFGCTGPNVCKTCHSDCETCIDDNQNSCLTCPGGSERKDRSAQVSGCQCIEPDYIRSVGKCVRKCSEHCELCYGSEPNQCLKCKYGYEYKYNSWPDCQPCASEDCRARNKPFQLQHAEDACLCTADQFFNTVTFKWESCSDNCDMCISGSICTLCQNDRVADHYWADDVVLCLDQCPFGNKVTPYVPKHLDQLITVSQTRGEDQWCDDMGFSVNIEFMKDKVPGQDRWEKMGMLWDSEGKAAGQKMIKLHGGKAALFTSTVPFLTDDRGLYFDGNDDCIRMDKLTFSELFYTSCWYKTSSGGTIFSMNTKSDTSDDVVAFGMNDGHFTFENSRHGVIWSSKEKFVPHATWDVVAFWYGHAPSVAHMLRKIGQTPKFNEYDEIALVINTNPGRNKLEYIQAGFDFGAVNPEPIDASSVKFIGSYERYGATRGLFEGFLYNFVLASVEAPIDVSGMTARISSDICIDCQYCYVNDAGDGECPGECDVYSYRNGKKCSLCPISCPRGCLSNGAC